MPPVLQTLSLASGPSDLALLASAAANTYASALRRAAIAPGPLAKGRALRAAGEALQAFELFQALRV